MMCKKLTFEAGTTGDIKHIVLYGIVESEDDNFLKLKTRNKTYQIAKRCILLLEDSDRIFREER